MVGRPGFDSASSPFVPVLVIVGPASALPACAEDVAVRVRAMSIDSEELGAVSAWVAPPLSLATLANGADVTLAAATTCGLECD